MTKTIPILVGLLALVGVSPARAAEPSLAPLSAFLTPAAYRAPLLSPDGTQVAWIGRHKNAFNIFVAPVDDMSKAKAITQYEGRGIKWNTPSLAVNYEWTPDGRYLLYVKDNDGDEHYRIYAVSPATGESRVLTPGDKIRSQIAAVSSKGPTRILAAIDTRFETESLTSYRGADLVEIDVATGARKLVMADVQYEWVLADNDLKVRLVATQPTPQTFVLSTVNADGTTKPFYTVGPDDVAGLSAAGETKSTRFSADNRTLFMLDVVGRDTVAMAAFDMQTGRKTVVAGEDKVDVRAVLFDAKGAAAHVQNWTRATWQATDPAIAPDLKFLQGFRDGDLQINGRSDDGKRWLVSYATPAEPVPTYLYDAAKRSMTKLFVSHPALSGVTLSPMHPFHIKSRDGLDLVSYYVLPPGADPDGDGKPDRPLPTLVIVHGGPTDERADYGFNPYMQWLASRGYAVMNVNYRGSAGFGKTYLNGHWMNWGGKMHDDVLDQVQWAVAQGLSDPKKVGIFGGSYGGYETLVAMTKSPDVFACGVDLVGPSDMSIPLPHFDLDWMAKVMGDPRTPEGIARLRSISPAYHTEKASNPLLIVQGDRDSRVPTVQSDIMVAALQKAGAPVVYLRYPDEGHGLVRPENTATYWSATEVFLSKCLGGRAEALDPAKFKGSSVMMMTGEGYLPELAAQVKAIEK
jgi:dipeptidyl aminopeptidase/acylaminoacyl peptidase